MDEHKTVRSLKDDGGRWWSDRPVRSLADIAHADVQHRGQLGMSLILSLDLLSEVQIQSESEGCALDPRTEGGCG